MWRAIFFPFFFLPAYLFSQSGILDTSFGLGGIVETRFIEGRNNLSFIIEQPDGKIIAGGWIESDFTNGTFILGRYREDGALDKNFGNEGKVITQFNQSIAVVKLIDFLPNNKILAFGYARETHDMKQNFIVFVRYNNDGSLDKSFGSEGKVIVESMDKYEQITSAVIQPNKKILALAHNRLDPPIGQNLGKINEYYLKKIQFRWNIG